VIFNDEESIKIIELMQKTNKTHSEYKFLFIVLDIFLKERKFNNTFSGGIGQFLLHNMILAFLKDFK